MIYVITGNFHKLNELKAILPPELDIRHRKLDLVEIQSLDPHEIVGHKLREAYKYMKAPVIVEDVSACLESLGGLPGPFIKFFEQQLGADALYKLSPNGKVAITCTMGYYDGDREIIVDGTVRGCTVSPRGKNGFGFDCCIIQEGQTRTNAELSPEVKNAISCRYIAATLMAESLYPKL